MTAEVNSYLHIKKEPFFYRHAWKVLLGMSLLIGYFGVSDMLGRLGSLERRNGLYAQHHRHELERVAGSQPKGRQLD
ncbi:MAG: hypothetical protein E4G99_02015 [Anaerolineales bacterium]|nr:MAG: hypothetical protein E4G99_02015 [Anaerolineales bacterium]